MYNPELCNFLSCENCERIIFKGVSWKINPTVAPYMWGIWERIKTALKVNLKNVKSKEGVLHTLLTKAEYTVNSKYFTRVSVDPNDAEAITPNHFIWLRPENVKTYGEIKEDIVRRKQWRFAGALANAYWRRWSLEYRTTLITRPKWHNTSYSLKNDDVVVIVDEKTPQNEWLMGKVVKVYPSKNGIVRVWHVCKQKWEGTSILCQNYVYCLPADIIPGSGEC